MSVVGKEQSRAGERGWRGLTPGLAPPAMHSVPAARGAGCVRACFVLAVSPVPGTSAQVTEGALSVFIG